MSDQVTCTFCVMDTSDPAIRFDSKGRCNHCLSMARSEGVDWFTDGGGLPRLESQIEEIKKVGHNRQFDCILGLSGGVDSSYLALKAFDWGLRPLVVHVDAGWNSEIAVGNIQRIIDSCGWELHTHVVNWEAMRELQVAYLRSGVANQDVPQDHAFFAALMQFATKAKIKHVLNGHNEATEGILPTAWQWAAMDAINLRAIHSKFGSGDLKDYPTVSFFKFYFWYPQVRRMTPVRALNLLPYNKDEATDELVDRIGWRPYGRKHGESLFTRFFQNFYLPERFGYDKRRPHLSSRIVSRQISREDALCELEKPLYEREELHRDREYILRKLRLTDATFQEMMSLPLRDAREFPNWSRRRDLAITTKERLGLGYRPSV